MRLSSSFAALIARLLAVVLVAVGLTMTTSLLAPAAHAAATGDDYPGYLKSAAQDSLVDPWNFYNRECTSFAAWRLNQQGGHSSAPWSFTNAMRGPNGVSVKFGNAALHS